jgi:hypothetical protein
MSWHALPGRTAASAASAGTKSEVWQMGFTPGSENGVEISGRWRGGDQRTTQPPVSDD